MNVYGVTDQELERRLAQGWQRGRVGLVPILTPPAPPSPKRYTPRTAPDNGSVAHATTTKGHP